MSYTLTFENINEQDVIEYEKSHNVNLREFIENLIKLNITPSKEYMLQVIESIKQNSEFKNIT